MSVKLGKLCRLGVKQLRAVSVDLIERLGRYLEAKTAEYVLDISLAVKQDIFLPEHHVGVLLVDVRPAPTKQDIQMLDYLTFNNIPVTIVATKYDKIKKSERNKKLTDIAVKLKVGIENIYLISSETAYGKTAIVERLYQFVDGE